MVLENLVMLRVLKILIISEHKLKKKGKGTTRCYKIERTELNTEWTSNAKFLLSVCFNRCVANSWTNDPAENRHLWSRELSRERETEVVRLFSSGERTKSIIRSAIEPRLDRNRERHRRALMISVYRFARQV